MHCGIHAHIRRKGHGLGLRVEGFECTVEFMRTFGERVMVCDVGIQDSGFRV